MSTNTCLYTKLSALAHNQSNTTSRVQTVDQPTYQGPHSPIYTTKEKDVSQIPAKRTKFSSCDFEEQSL